MLRLIQVTEAMQIRFSTHKNQRMFLCTLFLAALAAGCQSADDSASPAAARSSAESAEQLRAESAAFAGRPVMELTTDNAAMVLGERLFVAHCASCHGANGRGSRNSVDLTAGQFNYGTAPDAIRATIVDGRQSAMPPMGRSLGEVDLGQLVAYVQSLSAETTGSTSYQERGKMLFGEHCASCHGPEGRGSLEKGAPNLADDFWRNGDSMMNIRLAITRGIEAQCPAQGGVLSDDETNLLTAFVLKLVESARTPG
jgi:cytochrome c oxidase cbb3-type subunit 3